MSPRCVPCSTFPGRVSIDLFKPFPCPLIAILRGLTPAEAPAVGRILFDAGFRMLEVPLNCPGALDAIHALQGIAPDDALIGAGTVLSVGEVEAVQEAGGRLIQPHNMAAYVAAGASGFGIDSTLYQPRIDENALKRAAEIFMVARRSLLKESF